MHLTGVLSQEPLPQNFSHCLESWDYSALSTKKAPSLPPRIWAVYISTHESFIHFHFNSQKLGTWSFGAEKRLVLLPDVSPLSPHPCLPQVPCDNGICFVVNQLQQRQTTGGWQLNWKPQGRKRHIPLSSGSVVWAPLSGFCQLAFPSSCYTLSQSIMPVWEVGGEVGWGGIGSGDVLTWVSMVSMHLSWALWKACACLRVGWKIVRTLNTLQISRSFSPILQMPLLTQHVYWALAM